MVQLKAALYVSQEGKIQQPGLKHLSSLSNAMVLAQLGTGFLEQDMGSHSSGVPFCPMLQEKDAASEAQGMQTEVSTVAPCS